MNNSRPSEVQQKQSAEKVLSEQFARLDTSPVALSVADADADDQPLLYVNPAFSELTGYNGKRVECRNCRFLQGPLTSPRSVAEIRYGLRELNRFSVCLKNYKLNGEPFDNLLIIQRIRKAGIGSLFLGCQYDLSKARNSFDPARHLETIDNLATFLRNGTGQPWHQIIDANHKLAGIIEAQVRDYL